MSVHGGAGLQIFPSEDARELIGQPLYSAFDIQPWPMSYQEYTTKPQEVCQFGFSHWERDNLQNSSAQQERETYF